MNIDVCSLPEGWQEVRLGNVCEIKTGKSNTVDAVIDGKYVFFDRSKKVKTSNRFIFDCEALVIPGEGSQFFPRYYYGKFDLHQRVYAIYDFHKNINIRFVEYYFIFNHEYLERVAVGATVKSLRLRHFIEMKIPIPPLAEQKQITKKLDACFNEISQAKTNLAQNLQNTKDLFQSTLTQIFTEQGDDWMVKTLGEVCEFHNGLWKGKKPPYVNVGVIRNANFTKSCMLDDSNIAYLDVEERKFVKRKLQFGDLILERSGGGPKQPVGRVIIFNKKEGLFSFSNFTSVIRIKNPSQLSFQFLHLALYWHYIIGTTESMQRRSIGIRNLIFDEYKKIKIPTPSLVEQQQIAKKLDKLNQQTESLTNHYQNQLKSLETLKKSLLEKAFTGKLTANPKSLAKST